MQSKKEEATKADPAQESKSKTEQPHNADKTQK